MQPIVTPAEMAAIDAAAPEPVEVLIERAGAAVARAALALLGGAYGRRVVVVAGKGNNGADGRAAARRLGARGVRCVVVDAGAAPPVLPTADLLVDAAYGTGFRGSYQPPQPAGPSPVLAVDIPSGVDGATGDAGGDPWPATATVTFAAWKPGLLLGAGASLAGTVQVADIGLDTSSASAHVVEGSDVAGWLVAPARDTHKWRHAAWVVAGSPGMTGAARLATAAAQRAGAGYVRLSVPGGGRDVPAPVEAVVTDPGEDWSGAVASGAERFAVVAVGPGLGTDEQAAAHVRRLVSAVARPVVVDGDGLRALGRDAAAVIGARPAGAAAVVLTPHDGELEALTGAPPGADRVGAVRAMARQTGAIVLLKGPTTLVGSPDGEVLASIAGDARLATAGSGDVLTGTIAGLIASGLAPFHAAAAGAFLHATAGDLAWPRGLVASDLVDHLPAAFARVAGG